MVAWGYFFPPPDPPPREQPAVAETTSQPVPITPLPIEQPAPETTAAEEPEESPETSPLAGAELEVVEGIAEERVVIDGDTYRAEFTNRGAQLVSFQLREHQSAGGGPVDLVRARVGDPFLFGFASPDGASSPLNEALFRLERQSGKFGQETLVFLYQGPQGRVEKRFTFRPDGLLDVQIDAAISTGWTVVLGPGIRNPSSDETDSRFSRRSVVFKRADNKKVEKRLEPTQVRSPVGLSAVGLQWAGIDDTYFLTAAVPQEGLESIVVLPVLVVPGADGAGATFVPFRDAEQLGEEEAGLGRELYLLLRPEAGQLRFSAFLGAKEYFRLAALPYGLEGAVRLGWFKFLALPLLWGLRWIHDNVVANYGWAIILMTILVRLILFPLTHKSTVSMQKMQEVNPKVQAIRQKYRSKLKDKQGRPNAEMQRKMNEETMALYKAEGVNPAGGCLPMLLQMPVLFAFYNLLYAAIEIRHAPWMLWIQDLSAMDPYYVLPIVMGASQFLQQKMTPAAGDPMQRRMFAMMPIFFTILFLKFPSGLVLYWLTNNVLGIGQQLMYKRLREAKKADKQASAGGPGGKNGRGSRK